MDGETQVVPETTAYRVILDQQAIPVSQGAVTKDIGGPPRKAGRSHYYVVAIIVASVLTYFAVDEVFESLDKP